MDKDISPEILEQVEIAIKYEGYIKKELIEANKLKELDNIEISKDFDFSKVPNIASEAKDKLIKVSPISIGQAGRISGVNPSDIAILSVYLKRFKGNKDE